MSATAERIDHYNYTTRPEIFSGFQDWRNAVGQIDRIVIYARNKAGDVQPLVTYRGIDSKFARFVFTEEMVDRLAEMTGLTFNHRQRLAERKTKDTEQTR